MNRIYVARYSMIWGAHAPSDAHCGAPAAMLWKGKVRDGKGAIASTRGACAPQKTV